MKLRLTIEPVAHPIFRWRWELIPTNEKVNLVGVIGYSFTKWGAYRQARRAKSRYEKTLKRHQIEDLI